MSHLFRSPGLEFTFSYPDGWTVQRLGEKMVSLLGPRDSELERVHLFFHSSGYGGGARNLDQIVGELQNQLRLAHADATLETAAELSMGNLVGRQILASYRQSGESTCQWFALLSDEDGFFFFLYLDGPTEIVEKNRDLLERMFHSLRPVS